MELEPEQTQPNKFVIYTHEQAFRHITQVRTDREQELYILTDEALYYVWDANCLSISDQHREEYLVYLPPVFDILINSIDGAEIIEYLMFIEESQYGTAKDDNLSLERASRLVNTLLDYKKLTL